MPKIQGKPDKPVGMDDFVEDVFGLNIRGLNSIITLFHQPAQYFAAAAQPDWKQKFTPSIRLWFSLFALWTLLQFVWFSEGSPFVEVYAEGLREANVALPEGHSYASLGEEVALWVYGLAPILLAFTLLLIGSLYRFWGQPMTVAASQRYLFGVAIPGSAAMIALMLMGAFAPAEYLRVFGYVSAVTVFMLDAVTGYRGAFKGLTGGRRWLRTIVLAVTLFFANVVTNIVAQIGGIVIVAYKYSLSG